MSVWYVCIIYICFHFVFNVCIYIHIHEYIIYVYISRLQIKQITLRNVVGLIKIT